MLKVTVLDEIQFKTQMFLNIGDNMHEMFLLFLLYLNLTVVMLAIRYYSIT